MNFFGHAAVAAWLCGPDDGGAALGAMLPDFAGMVGARAPSARDARITAGIELHHRTDAAFHRLPGFVTLQRELDHRLGDAGCRRGPARATAHIGVELLLDGALSGDGDARVAYLAALEVDAELTWREDDDAERYAGLLARLRDHGVPDDLRRPEVAAARVLRAISFRPLLRADDRDAAIIRRELAAVAPRVAAMAPRIADDLRAALRAGSATSGAADRGSRAATSPG
jgi:hypothetical protein